MLLANNFGKVVEVSDQQQVDNLTRNGTMHEATQTEIEQHKQYVAERNARAAAMGPKEAIEGVYYSTVAKSPDGYGMSRDLIKKELFGRGMFLSEDFVGQKVGLLYSYPYGVMQMRSDVRLIYTMFESDKIPDDWPEYLKEADEVLVPSKWCQEVFLRSGVESTVVPLGYNSEAFTYIDRPVPVDDHQDFTFLHYNSFNLRKGFREVLTAFTQEFRPDEPVKLILKTTLPAAPIPLPPTQYPNVEIITGVVSEAGLNDILARAHCFVYPSRGEGFGITPLEAMATGIPAIIPNAHGISEYFDASSCIEVKSDDRCPALYSRFKGQDVGQMVVCDINHLRKQMRYAYLHQHEMKELGKKAHTHAKRYTYKIAAGKLAEIITKWQDTAVERRQDGKYLAVERV